MCGCLEVIGRIVVGIISVIMAILGFALLVIGIMVKVQSAAITNLFSTLLETAKQQAASATGSSISLPTDNFNINDLVGGLAIGFIILGVIFLVIGVFGVAGACCKIKWMIIVYIGIVGVLLISQIALVIIIVVNRGIITDPPKAQLKTTMQAEYQGINGTDTQSLLWNVVMNGLQCCGIDGVADFTLATKWIAVWGPGSTPNFQSPVMCCKTSQFVDQTSACVTAPDATNSNTATGCYEKVWDFIFKGTTFIIFGIVDIGFFALLTFFSVVILHKIIREKKGMIV